jgi:hypothetical protein
MSVHGGTADSDKSDCHVAGFFGQKGIRPYLADLLPLPRRGKAQIASVRD